MTDVQFRFRKGAGSNLDVLFGTVTLKPTLAHSRGTSMVLPAPSTWDIINGEVLATNVQPTPEPVDGVLEWGYEVTVKDRHGKSYSFLVGVPDSTTAVEFVSLPRYFETKPPLFGQGPKGDAGEAATISVGTVTSGAEASVINSGTANDAKLDFVLPQGPQGPQGVGVNYKPNDYPVDSLPDTYLDGVTLHQSMGTGTTWPLTYATITTEKRTAGRVIQTVSNSSNRIFQRSQTGSVWTPFKEIAWADLATASSDGLMSKADKNKLNSATPDNVSNTLVLRDTSNRFKASPPESPEHVANKQYVDGEILNLSGKKIPSLKDFGAVGDGETDDTAAVVNFLEAGGGIVPSGNYKLTYPINTAKRVNIFSAGGKFVYSGAREYVFTFTSPNNIIRGLEITSTVSCRGGIRSEGDNPTIKDCYIHDLYSEGNCSGISVDTLQGGVITNNTIENIRADIASGGTTAYARGISIGGSGAAKKRTYIVDNIIKNIVAYEGDAITVLFTGGNPPYLDGKAVVADNQFEVASRRYIKIQASHCSIKYNHISEPYRMVFDNPSFSIAVIEGSNNEIIGNSIFTVLGGISISGVTSAGGTGGNRVEYNSIESLLPEGGAVGVYAPSQNNFTIIGNNIRYFNRAVGIQGNGGVVANNTRSSVHGYGQELVSATNTSTRIAVVNNIDFSSTDSKKISNLSADGITSGNVFLGIVS